MKNEAVQKSILGMVLAVFLGAAQMAQATTLEKPIVEKQSTTKAQPRTPGKVLISAQSLGIAWASLPQCLRELNA